MNLLITINHLTNFGGAEKFILALVKELNRREISTFIYAIRRGESYQKALDFGAIAIDTDTTQSFDAIVVNHNSTLTKFNTTIRKKTQIFQICHGIYPYLEQPITNLNGYFAVSKEVQKFLKRGGIQSTILPNPVLQKRQIGKQRDVDFLVLCQGQEAIRLLENSIDPTSKCIFGSKHKAEINDVEELMLRSKVVIGTGRAIIEATIHGCAAFCLDSRHYDGLQLVGPVNKSNWPALSISNFSGRGIDQEYQASELAKLLKDTVNSWEVVSQDLLPLAMNQHSAQIISEKLLSHITLSTTKRKWYKRTRIIDLRTPEEKAAWERR